MDYYYSSSFENTLVVSLIIIGSVVSVTSLIGGYYAVASIAAIF